MLGHIFRMKGHKTVKRVYKDIPGIMQCRQWPRCGDRYGPKCIKTAYDKYSKLSFH